MHHYRQRIRDINGDFVGSVGPEWLMKNTYKKKKLIKP